MGLEVLRVLFDLFRQNSLADISPDEIAEQLGRPAELIESVVRQLLVHGFAERTRRTDDEAKLFVRITPEGLTMLG